jgi:hypothetical protein
MAVKVFWFGTGNMYFIPPAVSPAVPTPVKCGVLQEGSVEFAFTSKQVFGQNQFAEANFRAQGKITGKSKMASLNMAVIAGFFGSYTPATGQILPAINEAHSVPAVSTYIVTITPPASGTFNKNLGVVYAATGIPLTRVAAGSEALGAYSVNETTGVYTFAAADEGAAVLIDYLYTVSTVGQTLTVTNQLAGLAPTFMCVLDNITGTAGAVLILNNCMSEKLTLATKVGDVAIPEFDFIAAADQAENIGILSLPY